MMLIDGNHRALDFQYILWRFDTKELDTVTLNRLDAGPNQDDENDEDAEFDTEGNPVAAAAGGKKVEYTKSSCCTIF